MGMYVHYMSQMIEIPSDSKEAAAKALGVESGDFDQAIKKSPLCLQSYESGGVIHINLESGSAPDEDEIIELLRALGPLTEADFIEITYHFETGGEEGVSFTYQDGQVTKQEGERDYVWSEPEVM